MLLVLVVLVTLNVNESFKINFRLEKSANPDERAAIFSLKAKLEKRKNQFHELEDVLPHENGSVWLYVCLCAYVCVRIYAYVCP